jgi:hypothetical protein
MAIKATKLSVSFPFGLGKLEFEPNETQQRAAWVLYVELETRSAIQPLEREQGLLREVLDSLYLMFSITRGVLCEAGPEVAAGPNSLGIVALQVLNQGLRPFTSKWHPRLLAHEAICPKNISQLEHERHWEHYEEMQTELGKLQDQMKKYADALAEIAGVKTEN